MQGLYERVEETITREVLCVTVEIVNSQLRRWIGLKPGQERHYDLQVALTHDPITLLHVYTIVQVRCPCSFPSFLLTAARQ
jgi:hypothetical protein